MSDLDITDAALAELRSAADIVEVISEHTRLKKAGRSWKGLCPFHSERTPSFNVNRDKGLYYCFGCGAGGDVIHFVRQIDRLDFPDAVEALAQRFGVVIPQRRSRGPRDDRREKLLEAVAAAQRFYAGQLEKPGNRAAAYLDERAVPAPIWGKLGLGYAPDSWESLAKAIGPAYPETLLLEAGLLQPRPEGKGSYDRFRNRLLFVLKDERGRPVGFGGRALSADAEPKYLNSPESPIFLKKRILYGLSDAREAIRKHDRAVLVEGYFDHLALLLAGLEETVASMGTALTPEQAEKLRRLCARVVLCYDGDAAGRNATRGALSLLLAQGLAVQVARLPESQDPYDVLQREGPASLAARVEEAPDYLTWLMEDLRPSETGISSSEKRERCRFITEVLKTIPDKILSYEEHRRLAQQVSIPLDVLWERPRAAAPEAVRPAGTPGNAATLSTGEVPAHERRLLQILAHGSGYNSLILGTLREEWLTHPTSKRVVAALRGAAGTGEAIDSQRQIAQIREDSDIALLARLTNEDSPEATEQSVLSLLARLEEQDLDRKSAALQAEIGRAESAGGPHRDFEDLVKEKTALKRKRAGIQKARKGRELGD
jgi:DNA primase